MAIALPAIPLIVKFAEIAGIVVSGVATAAGLDKLSNKVETYIQENPEQSQKIFAMIMPEQGIANILKNKSSEGDEISEEELGEIDVEEKPKLTGKEKSERIKATIRRARAGKGNYSSPDATGPAVDIGGSVIREVEDMGIADKNLKDKPYKEKGYDFRDYIPKGAYKRRKADGGAIGLDSLLQPERKKFNEGSNWWDTLSDQGMGVYNAMKRGGHDDPTIQNQLSMLGYYDSNSTPNSNPVDNQPNQPSQGIINQNINQYQSGNQGGADDKYTGFGDFGNLDPNTKKTMQVEVADGKGGVMVKQIDTYLDNTGARKTLDNKNPINAGHNVKTPAMMLLNTAMGIDNNPEFLPEGKILGPFNNPNYEGMSFFQKIKANKARRGELKELQNQSDLQAKMKRQIAKEEAAAAEAAAQAAAANRAGQIAAQRGADVGVSGGGRGSRRGDADIGNSQRGGFATDDTAGFFARGGRIGYNQGGLASMFKRKR